MRLSHLLTAVAAVFLIMAPAHAKYVVLSKAPKGYLNKTQQAEYNKRLVKEYRTYQKHKSKNVRGWHADVKKAPKEAKPKLVKVYSVSSKLVQYKTERVDVWSTPGETISRGFGDCDDFANMYLVAAYIAGVDISGLWLVAGYHYNGKKREGHAIAVIKGSDGKQYVLDNLFGRVVPEKEHKSFKPVYSINIEKQAAFFQVNTAFKDTF